MIKDKVRVKEKLREVILKGYNPWYDFDNAIDHGADWFVLSNEEFDKIVKKAKEDRENRPNRNNDIESGAFDFTQFIENIQKRHVDKNIPKGKIIDSIKGSISIGKLRDNLGETQLTEEQIDKDLEDFGFKGLLNIYRLSESNLVINTSNTKSNISICSSDKNINPFTELFHIKASPKFTDPIPVDENQEIAFNAIVSAVISGTTNDQFLDLYRNNVDHYYEDFMTLPIEINREKKSSKDWIGDFLLDKFRDGIPKYMITTGIGANEQFNHFVASINNRNKDRKLNWLIKNSPKELVDLPHDATIDNTLFVEFSRSGKTEETVKIHEYTPINAHRIVFANKGDKASEANPLYELGILHNNLVLKIPGLVSGRFGRNKTPILLAPMYIAGMDVDSYWSNIDLAVNKFDLKNPNSLPNVIAKYIYQYQNQGNRNLIYLGCNDENLSKLCDEFIQFWNEGVNKDKNDLIMSRFFGLPRDSHMNIEGILGNNETKLGIFVLRTNMRMNNLHPLISPEIVPINEKHSGLQFGDEEAILAYANYKQFSEKMPTILIEIPMEPTLEHSAILGQLFSDVTYVYSRLKNIDPGSNPAVKDVRDRSGELLAKVATQIKNKVPIYKAIEDLK